MGRFEVVAEEKIMYPEGYVDELNRNKGGTLWRVIMIIKDKQTGVLYSTDGSGNLSPLLDVDGKPLTAYYKVRI